MSTSWYNTRAGKEWRILMQDMCNLNPGLDNERAEMFAASIASFCEISSAVVLGWIKYEKVPSIDNLQRTIDVFMRVMRYRPSSADIILEGTRNFKKDMREKPYVEDKIERLARYLRNNTGLLDKLVHEYCDAPEVITARITSFDQRTNKYHVHFYDFAKSNTAFMRERINTYSQIRNLLESATVRNQIAHHIRSKNFTVNLDLEHSIREI